MPSLVGNKPNQVPSNGDLGTLAFQDSNAVNITGGIVDVSAGTAALPTLGTTGDPNTGVFFPAADTVAVATNGVERVRVDSSGNLGVGITPSYKLDVFGNVTGVLGISSANTSSAGNSYALLRAASDTTEWGVINYSSGTSTAGSNQYQQGASALLQYAGNASYILSSINNTNGIRFFTSSTATSVERMRISASGGLSIGTTADAGAGNLVVTGSATIQGLTVGKGAGASSFSTAFGISALSSQTDTLGYNTAVGYRAARVTTSGVEVNAFGRETLASNTTGSEISAFGDVALFSNTTGNKNTAVGTGALYGNTTASNNTAIGYNSGNLITTGAKNTIIGTYSGNQGGLDIRTASNHIVLSDGDGNPRQIINSAGNVGIGTTSPASSAILDVQSTTKGVRMPNMTTTQKNAIASPVAGLMVFDTTLAKLCVYSGSAWETITSI